MVCSDDFLHFLKIKKKCVEFTKSIFNVYIQYLCFHYKKVPLFDWHLSQCIVLVNSENEKNSLMGFAYIIIEFYEF